MGYCINCDNRHGCKTANPRCLGLMDKNGVKGERGKDYMLRKQLIEICKDCPHFRSCWDEMEYKMVRDRQK